MSALTISVLPPRDEDIDNDILIQKVNQRPVLYDRNLDEYSDVNIKKMLWREVCAELFSGIWEKLPEPQQIKTGIQYYVYL